MPTYDTVEQAIKAIRDPETLAEVASVILAEKFPDLVMSGMSGDLGRDAVARKAVWGDEYVVVQYSLAQRWPEKVDRELARYERDPTLPKRMIYVTHRPTQPKAAELRRTRAREQYGVKLEIYGYGWLWPRLEREFRGLAEELLNVRPRLPDRFVDAADRGAQLAKRIPGFSAPIVETDSHRRLRSALAKPIDTADACRVVVLAGAGGLGKTRAAIDSVPAGMPSVVLQAAQRFEQNDVGALDPNAPGVLIIDDAHRVEDLGGLRLLLDEGAWRGWRVIMTLRPGYAEDVLERAGLEADEVREIEFARLTREQASQLLANPPYRISAPDVATHILRLAEGTPLMLHLAAEALSNRGLSPQTQGALVRAHVSRLLRSLPGGLHRDLIALAALLGRLAVGEQLERIRQLHPAVAVPDLRSALIQLSDAGLGLYIEDVFTVTPESIAPIIVLDDFLRTSGTTRLRLGDLSLSSLSDAERGAMLPTLTGAVVYGDGEGREVLRALAVRPVTADSSPATITQILREARIYVRALPDDAERAVARTLADHREALAQGPGLLDAATGVARALADVDIARGLRLLLSLVALRPATERNRPEGPAESLSTLLEQSPTSFSSPALTERAVQGVDAIARWLREAPPEPTRQAVALRAALMLVAVAHEWVGPSASDAMAIQLGAVLAPPSPAHRTAINGAVRFVTNLISDASPDALLELRGGYPALLHRLAGMYPPLTGPLPDWHRRTIRSATSAVRTAILERWDEVPIAVRLACYQHDTNRRLLAQARADAELDRYAILFLVTAADRPHTDEWSRQLRRALKFGRTLSPDEAIDLAEQAVAIADRDLSPTGIGNVLGGAGERARRSQAAQATTRMRQSAALRRLLGAFLPGVAAGAGLSLTSWRRLASDPETASYVPAVLDQLDERYAQQLTEILLTQPSAHTALADHLRTSDRYDEGTRAQRLLDLAAATEDTHLADVLEQFGRIQGSVPVPDRLRSQLLDQMCRVARVAALDRRTAGNVSDAYDLIAHWRDRSWLKVVAARRDAMLASTTVLDYRMDLIPDQFTAGLHALTGEQRDDALPQVAAWLEAPEPGAVAWRVELGLEDLIVRLGAGRPAFQAIVAAWYHRDDTSQARALRLISALASRNAVVPVLAAVLASLDDVAADGGALVTALALPPMSWAGNLEQEYTRRAADLRTGLRGRRGPVQAFARVAIDHLEKLAADERARSQARSDSYTS